MYNSPDLNNHHQQKFLNYPTMSTSSAFDLKVTMTQEFKLIPGVIRENLNVNYKSAALRLIHDAESGIVNELKQKYAVVFTHGDKILPKTIIIDNMTTTSSANLALLEYFIANHRDKFDVQGTGLVVASAR
jgi:hypothetical protein